MNDLSPVSIEKRVARERVTEQRIRSMDVYDIVDEIHHLEDRCEELERRLVGVERMYGNLLFSVETKHPNETRHETALRYIQQAEQRHNDHEQEKTDG